MPWIIGIDEAGYGPNLGPLVMTSVACRVPSEHDYCDLWEMLRPTVRRPTDPEDDRVVVGDSKLVYSVARGLHDLEASVMALVAPASASACLAELLESIAREFLSEVRGEAWYTGATPLPRDADGAACRRSARRFQKTAARQGIRWGSFYSTVVCPTRFNQCLNRWGLKPSCWANH